MTIYEDLRIRFSSSFRELRRARKFRYVDLEERAGVSMAMLKKIGKGEANPSLRVMSQIAEAYGVNVRDML